MQIKINNKIYKAKEGEMIFDVCKRNGIRIPSLCSGKKLKKEAVCRLCLVEINLTDKLVPSCAFPVCENLEVVTESKKIEKARKINMELLWSDHAGKCVTCKKNLKCKLQNLAEEYKIENFHFVPRKGEITDWEELDLLKDNKNRIVVDNSNPAISRTTEFCVECRKCINICPTKEFGFNYRAGDVVVGTPYEKPLDCIFCGQCIKNCPTAAITDKNDLKKIISDLDDLKKMAVALVDPAIFESIQHEFPEIESKEKFIGLLRKIGFEKVFDLSWGMEKYVSEAAEQIKKRKELALINYCPSFVLYIKKYFPELKNNLLNVFIPDDWMAEAVKNGYARREKINPKDISVISISSCTAKKAVKGQFLDYVMTLREVGRIFRDKKIENNSFGSFDFDKFLPARIKYSGKMIKSGGVLKSILNSSVKKKKSIAVSSMEDIEKVLRNIKTGKAKYDLIEAMICENGCVNGGGQSKKI